MKKMHVILIEPLRHGILVRQFLTGEMAKYRPELLSLLRTSRWAVRELVMIEVLE